MIENVRRHATGAARVFAYFYAVYAALIVGAMTVIGYTLGGAAYSGGWTVAHLDAEMAGVVDTVVVQMRGETLGDVMLAVSAPILALVDDLLVGAARLGYATHSAPFALLLIVSLLTAVACFTVIKLDAAFGGETDG